MVAAANKALSATADGNQKKPVFPGFIPLGATPQQAAAALAARPAPNVLAGTGLGMGDPMNKMPPLAPAVGGELAPAFGSGLYGPNARYNALPQDNSQNVGAVAVPDKPIKPVQPGFIPERSAALDRSAAVAQPQAAPAAAPAPSLNAPWYSPEYARAAGMSDKGGLELERMRAANAPAGLPTNDPARRILTTGTASTGPSTAAAAPATPAAATALQNPLRVQEAKLGLSNPGTAPLAAPAGEPQRNASGALTNLGTGTDVGFGVTRYNIPGQSPLFTNKTGDSGAADNMALMNRGAPTAQNAAAMDNLVARSEKQISDGVKMLQHQDQVAAAMAFREAQARQEQSRSFAERLNNPRSEESVAINNLQRQLKPNLGESPAAFAARTAAVQAQINAITGAESLSSAERQATNQLGFKRDELTAKQQLEQSNLGLKRQQVGNELATGAQSRDAKGMEIAAAKQLQTLQAQLLDPKATDAQRLEVGKKIAALQGKTEKPDQWDSVVVNGGTDALGNKIGGSAALFNKTTGEYKAVGAPGAGGGQTPTAANINALKNNPNLAKDFDAKFGNGASATILGAN